MALILSIETSASACSVALYEDDQIIKTLEIQEPQSHASKLAVLIKEVFNETSLNISLLSAVAISSGPGSYTGLRIGTSTAKGICYAINIPLIAVKTLDLLGHQALTANKIDGLLCPMIDAKRMEVYCQIMGTDLQILSPMEAKVIDENSFTELLEDQKMFFFGDGVEKSKQVIKHRNAHFLDNIYPAASALGLVAYSKFENKQFEDQVNYVPLYLKDFVAKKAQSVF